MTRYVPQPRPRRALPANDDEEADDEEEDLADDLDELDVDGDGEGPDRSKAKYMKVLRKVANRQTSEIIVDLADLRKVRCIAHPSVEGTC